MGLAKKKEEKPCGIFAKSRDKDILRAQLNLHCVAKMSITDKHLNSVEFFFQTGHYGADFSSPMEKSAEFMCMIF